MRAFGSWIAEWYWSGVGRRVVLYVDLIGVDELLVSISYWMPKFSEMNQNDVASVKHLSESKILISLP